MKIMKTDSCQKESNAFGVKNGILLGRVWVNKSPSSQVTFHRSCCLFKMVHRINCLFQDLTLNVPKQYMHPSWKPEAARKEAFLHAFSCSFAPSTCTASATLYPCDVLANAGLLCRNGWGVKRIFLHLGSWQSLAFLGVPWRSLADLGGPWRTLADLPKSLATMPHGNVSHKPWEWPCSQLCLNAGKDLWASGLKFQKWWNTYGTLEKIWKEFHKDKSRGAEKMRICIGRCANGAASLRAAVPCLNMET